MARFPVHMLELLEELQVPFYVRSKAHREFPFLSSFMNPPFGTAHGRFSSYFVITRSSLSLPVPGTAPHRV